LRGLLGLHQEIEMASRKGRASSQSDALQILRGGKAVPRNLVNQCIADLQQRRSKELSQRNATERKMAKFLGDTRSLPKPATQGLDKLLGLHQKLARQKILAPRVAGGLGGILPGRITATIVPPFDYDIVISSALAGNAAIREATSDKATGKMSASAITSSKKGFGGGSAYTTLGVYFHPLGPGTLSVHATPSFSFQWWTNSIGANSLVRSFGSGGLTVYGVDVASQTTGEVGTIVSTASTRFKLWDENQTDQVRFDFGFDIQAPTSVQLDVNHDLVYLLFVDADVHVEGIGWPGSLAGAKMAVTVPSITYDFQVQQVLQQ
jgi:hypothetical protein